MKLETCSGWITVESIITYYNPYSSVDGPGYALWPSTGGPKIDLKVIAKSPLAKAKNIY